jgi:hypothetical protein
MRTRYFGLGTATMASIGLASLIGFASPAQSADAIGDAIGSIGSLVTMPAPKKVAQVPPEGPAGNTVGKTVKSGKAAGSKAPRVSMAPKDSVIPPRPGKATVLAQISPDGERPGSTAPRSSGQKPVARGKAASRSDRIIVRWHPCNCPIALDERLDDFDGIERRLWRARQLLNDSHLFPLVDDLR